MKLLRVIGGLVAGAIVFFAVDRMTQTGTDLPGPRRGDAETVHPSAREFSRTPIARTYAERRRMFLEWAARRPTPNDRGGIFDDMVKLEQGAIAKPSPVALKLAVDFVNAREDPSDFALSGLIRLYYLHHADGKLGPEQREAIRRALLDYKYALDEPGKSMTQMWTENHQMLSHSSEYLAGQMFPDEVFTVDGAKGREHMERARGRLLRWFEYHARTGMAEWDSIPYYDMELAALLNLVEFARAAKIQVRATMMVDLLLFDVAVDSFYGQFGTSHGRATARTIRSAAGDSLLTFQTVAFGRGRFQSVDMATAMLVTGHAYSLPPVLEDIGVDTPEESLNFERHSIPLTAEAASRYGLSFSDIGDAEIWWGMGAFTSAESINLTFDAVKKYDLWHYSYFRSLRTVAGCLRPLGLLPALSRSLDPDSNGTLLSEVNKVSYRTPDVMLSTAQDYRRGEKGYQQHIWQATLGPYAVVFATNPGSLDLEGRPSYWAGNARMPRNAQYRNVLISIYDIPRHESLPGLESRHYGFTHAWFPKWAFDEVGEAPASGQGWWVFGRAADGYVGLYSEHRYRWTTQGPDAGEEIVVPGLTNVWICEVGRKTTDGSFQSFIEKVLASKVAVDGTNVTYHSEGLGEVKFGWSGPFTVGGREIPLRGYPRWDNAYAHVPFGSRQFHIERAGETLDLDFENAVRTVSVRSPVRGHAK